MSVLLQALVSGLAMGAVFAAVGLGFVLVYRVTNVINFAQGAFVVLGGMFTAKLATGVAAAGAALAALGASALAGAAVGWFALAGWAGQELAVVMVTLGVAVASEGIFIWLWGDIPVTYPPVGSAALDLFGAKVLPQQLLVIGVIAGVFVALHLFFNYSYLGKALTAAALNPAAARVCGIDTMVMGVVAFAVSSLLSGLAGLLLVPLVPFTPHVHVSLAINGFAAAVVGRLTDPLRAILGGLLLGELEAMVASYWDPNYQEVIALALLVGLLLTQSLRWSWWRARGKAA
jgi:branched-chain amino acid transport system permease protein